MRESPESSGRKRFRRPTSQDSPSLGRRPLSTASRIHRKSTAATEPRRTLAIFAGLEPARPTVQFVQIGPPVTSEPPQGQIWTSNQEKQALPLKTVAVRR